MRLVVALGYGGRWDILQAARRWVAAGEDDSDPEASFAGHLSTAGLPDVDLLVRTGGESRISNFLLWQAAYAELLFIDTFWPDVSAAELQEGLSWYARRQRRFGRVLSGSAPVEPGEVPSA